MKKYIVLLALSGCFILNGAESSTNLLSISLVDNKDFLSRHPSNSNDVKIVFPPVLADKDFVAFNTTNQTFTISPEAAKRLASAIWTLGKKYAPGRPDAPTILWTGDYELIPTCVPFVLQISGETIYHGIFGTLTSSDSYSEPFMIPDQAFIGTNSTNKVTFWSFPSCPGLFSKDGQLFIDSRLVSALQKLFSREKR